MNNPEVAYKKVELPSNVDEASFDFTAWLLKNFGPAEDAYYYGRSYKRYNVDNLFNLKIFFLTSKVTLRKVKNEYILIVKDKVQKYTEKDYKEKVAKPAAMWITYSQKKFWLFCDEELLLRLNIIAKKKFDVDLIKEDKKLEEDLNIVKEAYHIEDKSLDPIQQEIEKTLEELPM